MKLPDTSNDERMAKIGRITVLRKARREAAQLLRDKVVPMLNEGSSYDVAGIVDLVQEIEALNELIESAK